MLESLFGYAIMEKIASGNAEYYPSQFYECLQN